MAGLCRRTTTEDLDEFVKNLGCELGTLIGPMGPIGQMGQIGHPVTLSPRHFAMVPARGMTTPHPPQAGSSPLPKLARLATPFP